MRPEEGMVFIDLLRLQCFVQSVRLGVENNRYVMGAFWKGSWTAEEFIGNEYDVALGPVWQKKDNLYFVLYLLSKYASAIF
jgi:hypothetical protein